MFAQQGALWSVLLTKYHSGDRIKEKAIRRTNGTCGRQKRCVQGFGGGDMSVGDHLEDLGVDWG